MKARRNGFASGVAAPIGAAALLVVALVAVIGSAQAAPTTKIYSATVHVANAVGGPQIDYTAETATLTLTLKNESKNTLGSAEFDATDLNVTPTVPSGTEFDTTKDGWTARFEGGVVKFLSTGSAAALTKGQDVSADVPVSFAGCDVAAWTTRAKQSNDFSGNPGNDFAINAALSNLTPLGSFTIDPIGTDVNGQLVPQIYVSELKTVAVHAFDLCGQPDGGYGTSASGNAGDVATLSVFVDTPARLVGAGLPKTITSWPAGSASMTPGSVETVDRVVATDSVSAISYTSDDFDVVKTICTSGTTECTADSPSNKVHIRATVTPEGASLGFGFKASTNQNSGFECDGSTAPAVGATLVYMNPRDYPENAEPQDVALTFDKSLPGTGGPVSNFDICLSKENGKAGSWSATPIPDCSAGTLPCVEDRERVSGNLVITVRFDPFADPLGGAR